MKGIKAGPQFHFLRARRRSNAIKFYFRSAHRTSDILPSCGGKAACTASGSGNVRLMAQTPTAKFWKLECGKPIELGGWKSGKKLESLGPDFDIVGWTSGKDQELCYLISTGHLHKQLQQLDLWHNDITMTVAANAAQAEWMGSHNMPPVWESTGTGTVSFSNSTPHRGSCACFASIFNILSWAGRKNYGYSTWRTKAHTESQAHKAERAKHQVGHQVQVGKGHAWEEQFPKCAKLLIFQTSRRVLTQQLIIYLTLMPLHCTDSEGLSE